MTVFAVRLIALCRIRRILSGSGFGFQHFHHLVGSGGCGVLLDLSIHFGEVVDISGIVGQNIVYCVWVALMGFDNGFIGEKFTHGLFPP